VEGVEDKGGDVAGYMPLQRQVGFIYDNPNLFIIAHELGHGAFNLRHTFSPESFIAAERTTQNLMDYAGGTELWKHQWEQIRDPQNIWFAWAQEEGEGEMMDFNMSEEMILDLLKSIRKANANSKDELDLSFFQLSKGSKLDVEIEPATFWYLGISTNSGEKVLSSSELSFHPLMINPSDFSKVNCEAPKGLDGRFMKFTFKLYSPTLPPRNPGYYKTEFNAIEITVNSEWEYYLEAYLLNKEIPKPGDQFVNMEIVPSGTHGRHGGVFGCTRTSKTNCSNYDNKYENPGIQSGTQFHSGVDVRASVNTPLRPALAGIVFSVTETFTPGVYVSESLGNKIIIRSTLDDGRDVYIMYCYLNEVNVNVGDTIKVGQIIGLTGDTGNAGVRPDGTRGCSLERLHVHIEATRDGVFFGGAARIDPSMFITTKFDRNGNQINDN